MEMSSRSVSVSRWGAGRGKALYAMEVWSLQQIPWVKGLARGCCIRHFWFLFYFLKNVHQMAKFVGASMVANRISSVLKYLLVSYLHITKGEEIVGKPDRPNLTLGSE